MQKFWRDQAFGNASEHIYEEVKSYKIKNKDIDSELYSQLLLEDFHGALENATRNGIVYGKIITQGNWKFEFGPPREPGQSPAIIHSQFNGWH